MNLKNLKPGDIFVLTDIIDEEVNSYQGKNKTPKKKRISYNLEEWHAVCNGDYPNLYLYSILFKKSNIADGVQKSKLKEGEFIFSQIPWSVYDTEPPTKIEIIKDKELRMIIGGGETAVKLVSKRKK